MVHTLTFRVSWSKHCSRIACVLGSCTSSHLSSSQFGDSVFLQCSCGEHQMSHVNHSATQRFCGITGSEGPTGAGILQCLRYMQETLPDNSRLRQITIARDM